MEEQEKYVKLQDAKYALQKSLEDIKKWDGELGASDKDTFIGEVHPIIEEVFPEYLDY